MPKKCVLILLDGLGDRSFARLDHQTPLQAARTPCMDRLARLGASGLYHAGEPGQALPSENAHFAMFGYDPDDFPGRGALEALGIGLELNASDVAVLVHFASLEARGRRLILKEGKVSATEAEFRDMFRAAATWEKEGVDISLHRTYGGFGILVMRGDVSPCITDSDPITHGLPLCEVLPWKNLADDPAARRAASALKSYLIWVYKSLEEHPVNHSRQKNGIAPINGMVSQRAGRLRPAPPFFKRFGMKGVSISSGIVYRGLCRYLGLDFRAAEDTADPGTDLADRLVLARDLLKTYDFIHVHTKTPDEAAHAKDPILKKRVIESLDRGLGAAVDPLLDDPDAIVILTSDHSTPSAGPLVHSGEPVPLTIRGDGVRRDRAARFDEVSAAGGALGCMRGREFMNLVLNYTDRAKLRGLMDAPEDQPFWPGHYTPFDMAGGDAERRATDDRNLDGE